MEKSWGKMKQKKKKKNINYLLKTYVLDITGKLSNLLFIKNLCPFLSVNILKQLNVAFTFTHKNYYYTLSTA